MIYGRQGRKQNRTGYETKQEGGSQYFNSPVRGQPIQLCNSSGRVLHIIDGNMSIGAGQTIHHGWPTRSDKQRRWTRLRKRHDNINVLIFLWGCEKERVNDIITANQISHLGYAERAREEGTNLGRFSAVDKRGGLLYAGGYLQLECTNNGPKSGLDHAQRKMSDSSFRSYVYYRRQRPVLNH